MADAPTLPVTGPRPRLRARVRARVLPWRIVAMGLTALTGLAWLGVLSLGWNPLLAAIGGAVAASCALIPLRARVAQVAVRAALWASFVSGLTVTLSGARVLEGAALALTAGGALLLLSRLGRRLRGRDPMMFLATVLAVADIGAHGLITGFVLPQALHDADLWFFPAIAAANLVGLACLRVGRTAVPHVVLNALVLVGAIVDVGGVKGPVDVAIGVVALLQIVAAILALRPPPSPAARRAALRWLRAGIGVGMMVALVVGVLGWP